MKINFIYFILLGVCFNYLIVIAYAYFYKLIKSVDNDLERMNDNRVEVIKEPVKDDVAPTSIHSDKTYSTIKTRDDDKEAVFEWSVNNK